MTTRDTATIQKHSGSVDQKQLTSEHATGRFWEANAAAWTALARKGRDVCRDAFNTPAFLQMLPPVDRLYGLDVGCGEGHNTRQVARLGARMDAIDISPTFIRHAVATEKENPHGIRYQVSSACHLPFADATFDFAVSFMCLMDIPHPDKALLEIRRVLKPSGFLQFSITHPCYDTPQRVKIRDTSGRVTAIALADYFRFMDGEPSEWIFGNASEAEKSDYPLFAVPRYNFTLSQWLNMISHTGFHIAQTQEPRPSADAIERHPKLAVADILPFFMHFLLHRR